MEQNQALRIASGLPQFSLSLAGLTSSATYFSLATMYSVSIVSEIQFRDVLHSSQRKKF